MQYIHVHVYMCVCESAHTRTRGEVSSRQVSTLCLIFLPMSLIFIESSPLQMVWLAASPGIHPSINPHAKVTDMCAWDLNSGPNPFKEDVFTH